MTARTLTVSLGTRDSVPPRSVSRCLNHSDEGSQFDRRWSLLFELLEKGMSIDTKGSCPHPPAVGKIKHNSLLGQGLNTLALSCLRENCTFIGTTPQKTILKFLPRCATWIRQESVLDFDSWLAEPVAKVKTLFLGYFSYWNWNSHFRVNWLTEMKLKLICFMFHEA